MYQIIFFIISINPYSILFKNKNKVLDNRHLHKKIFYSKNSNYKVQTFKQLFKDINHQKIVFKNYLFFITWNNFPLKYININLKSYPLNQILHTVFIYFWIKIHGRTTWNAIVYASTHASNDLFMFYPIYPCDIISTTAMNYRIPLNFDRIGLNI